MTVIRCEMKRECIEDVSYIDEKGFIYCKEHGKQRQYSMRCRQLKPKELAILKTGKPLLNFEGNVS